jgi:hypothetical protein
MDVTADKYDWPIALRVSAGLKDSYHDDLLSADLTRLPMWHRFQLPHTAKHRLGLQRRSVPLAVQDDSDKPSSCLTPSYKSYALR